MNRRDDMLSDDRPESISLDWIDSSESRSSHLIRIKFAGLKLCVPSLASRGLPTRSRGHDSRASRTSPLMS